MIRWPCILALLSAFMPVTAAEDATRGMKPLTVVDEQGGAITFSSSQALLIGNSAYTGGWSRLAGVQHDIVAIQAALERQGFGVQVATDLTKQGLSDILDTFIEEKAQAVDGRVLVYYAGHGHTGNGLGYLVGVDAPLPNEKGFLKRAYELATVKAKAMQARSRSVLFAFDSCFAGSVFTPMRAANAYLISACREPVRMFLTAGSADETVPDHSFFCEEFIAGIEGAADPHHTGYVTGSRLAVHIREQVGSRARAAGITLTPQSGVSEQTGFNKGDFIFQVPGRAEDRPAAPAAPAEGGLDLSGLQAQAGRNRELRKGWMEWQARMQAAFDQVKALAADPDLTLSARRQAWRKFLESYPQENPYSQDARRLRMAAGQALEMLVEVAGAPAMDPPDAGDPAWASASGRDRYGTWADLTVAGAGQRFRWIQPGTFTMGSSQAEQDAAVASVSDGKPEWFASEVPHEVTLTRGFWLADSACTQALWQALTGSNPSTFSAARQHPVEQVSWDDCQQFLSALNGKVPGGGFRLPTEAEWEYACRAGTTTPFSFGSAIAPEQVNYNGNFPFGGAARRLIETRAATAAADLAAAEKALSRTRELLAGGLASRQDVEGAEAVRERAVATLAEAQALYRQKTVPVRSLPPNPWGLYEMHGNVWQWCSDWYSEFSQGAERDPRGPSSGTWRVYRGGGWDSCAMMCRSAERSKDLPRTRSCSLGLRIAAQAAP